MSLTSNINLLGSRIATEFRTVRGLISGSETGDASGLATASKNVVGAINELKAAVDAGGGGGGFSGDYNDLTNTPDLSGYATTSSTYTRAAVDGLIAPKANSADVYTRAEVDAAIAAAGGGGSSLPTWTAIVTDVSTTGGLVLPGSLTWNGLKQTYQELGFYALNINDGTVGMSIVPTALAPNKFRPFVTLGSTTMMLCAVNDSAVGNYILSLGANCRFSLYGR